MLTRATGFRTESVNTDIIEVCPALGTKIAMVVGVGVTCGATAQDLYLMTPLGITWTMEFTRAGDTTTRIAETQPLRGKDITSGSIFVAINQYAQFEPLVVQSISNDVVTWVNGPNYDLLMGSLLYAYYDPKEESFGFPPTPLSPHPKISFPANETHKLEINFQAGMPGQDYARVSGIGVPVALLLTNDSNQASLEHCKFAWFDPDQDEITMQEGLDENGVPEPEKFSPVDVFPKP